MSYNLAELPPEERQKMAVDMTAAAVAYKLRYGMSVIVGQIELEQPPELREYFRERLAHHRKTSATLGVIMPQASLPPETTKR
ncbi:hypothetical protein FS594_28665 (plasmid) [Rahnella aquatilis]|nr:hypothetical protein FS594_28665 [Rahnella aquatilis]